MNIQNIAIGQVISFEMYPAHIYGNAFRNVTLSALLSPALANTLGLDVVSAHKQVYPSLPDGTVPNDPFQYNYLQVTTEGGESIILGVPWIRSDSIVINDGKLLTLVFQDIDDVRKDRIIAAIRANNETPDHITFI